MINTHFLYFESVWVHDLHFLFCIFNAIGYMSYQKIHPRTSDTCSPLLYGRTWPHSLTSVQWDIVSLPTCWFHASFLPNCFSLHRVHDLLHLTSIITHINSNCIQNSLPFSNLGPYRTSLQLKRSFTHHFHIILLLLLAFSICFTITSTFTPALLPITFHLRELYTLILLQNTCHSCTRTWEILLANTWSL